jgi:hypothetical protein
MLLPQWAKFVRGIIDSPDLEPTAARDNIRRNTPSFDFLQRKLGELIVERLIYLADHESNKFRQINWWHHYHLKGMAYFYDDFFEKVADTLFFDTNKGPMSLRDYLTKNQPRVDKDGKSPIYYFAVTGAAAQFYRLADARGWVVIDAGYAFEEELLKKYAQRNHRTVHLERLDATDDPELFQRLDPSAQERFHQLELDMEGRLRRMGLPNVAVQMRRFAPPELPAVIVLTPETEAEEKLRRFLTQPWFMGDMEEIAQEALKHSQRRTVYLSLNANNSLIQNLGEVDRRGEVVEEAMLGIYNSAVLYAQNFLTQSNADVIHAQVVRILERLVAQRGQVANVTQMLEQERRQLLDLRQRQMEAIMKRPDHIRLFMISPFADEYKPLERAVRRVFERPPYFFEMQLARDYTHKPGLLENVREHMMQAHGFIAEISDQTPNVMFELGAAMMPDDGRPVFTLRRGDATLPIPADFKEKLFIPYGTLNDPPEKLEADIRAAFERDGRITHEGILKLIEQRKKRFLSRQLLENLSWTKLDDAGIKRIMKYYLTVEDLLAAEPSKLVDHLELEDFVVNAIQGEMKRV